MCENRQGGDKSQNLRMKGSQEMQFTPSSDSLDSRGMLKRQDRDKAKVPSWVPGRRSCTRHETVVHVEPHYELVKWSMLTPMESQRSETVGGRARNAGSEMINHDHQLRGLRDTQSHSIAHGVLHTDEVFSSLIPSAFPSDWRVSCPSALKVYNLWFTPK